MLAHGSYRSASNCRYASEILVERCSETGPCEDYCLRDAKQFRLHVVDVTLGHTSQANAAAASSLLRLKQSADTQADAMKHKKPGR
jgi:hypothetical protein